MGQQIAVVERPSSKPGVVRFEANRTLTGMGHEVFRSSADAVGPRPAAVLARTLLSSGKVDAVHMYSNMVTVDLTNPADAGGLSEMVRDLYQYWKPGMEMPTFEDVAVEAGASVAAESPAGIGGPEAAFLALVPATLVDRSRAALAKWKAEH
ncbi:MAG: hypothetical protein HY826_05240 [Actinobacteria bacterium]|nr:hypothetical protein [Actinomycetota bacterium]